MKVMCIETPKHKAGDGASPIVIVGQLYTVIDQGNDAFLSSVGIIKEPWYELGEHNGYCYRQRHFIPLSDISETEMERDYNLVTNHSK